MKHVDRNERSERASQMVEYRIYSIGSDGHFMKSECLECPSDEEAIKLAGQSIDTCDVELWSGARVVARLNCHGADQGAPGIPAAACP
jgi:hypothetical protein